MKVILDMKMGAVGAVAHLTDSDTHDETETLCGIARNRLMVPDNHHCEEAVVCLECETAFRVLAQK